MHRCLWRIRNAIPVQTSRILYSIAGNRVQGTRCSNHILCWQSKQFCSKSTNDDEHSQKDDTKIEKKDTKDVEAMQVMDSIEFEDFARELEFDRNVGAGMADEMEETDEEEDSESDDSENLDAWGREFEKEISMWDARNVDDDETFDPATGTSDIPGLEHFAYTARGSMSDQWSPLDHIDENSAVMPEDLNWMAGEGDDPPAEEPKEKPYKYFLKANHQDIVELALDTELLRLFLTPAGRIRPRRFTGLKGPQQRKLTRGIKIARQLAMLPYQSRYPEPSKEQWSAIFEDLERKAATDARFKGNDEEYDDDSDEYAYGDDDDDEYEDQSEEEDGEGNFDVSDDEGNVSYDDSDGEDDD